MAKYTINKSRLMRPDDDKDENKKKKNTQKNISDKTVKKSETKKKTAKNTSKISKKKTTKTTKKQTKGKAAKVVNETKVKKSKQNTIDNTDAISLIRGKRTQRKKRLPSIDFSASGNILIDLFESILNLSGAILNKVKNSRALFIGILSGALIAFIIILLIDFSNVQKMTSYKPNVVTKLYDKNGILFAEFFNQKRDLVPFEKIPKHLQHAFIAIEDAEFYNHFGVNPKGIVRALFVNLISGRIKQGGSTITQQLAKNVFTDRKRSIYRKIKEAFIALMLEMKFTKNEIMNLYLNQIYLGHGAYGVESAAQFYFKKHVWELNVAESALLATLPSSPKHLSPIRNHPRVSWRRHRVVLSRMVELGFISKERAEKAYLEFWPAYLQFISKLPPTYNTASSRLNKAPWFTEYIRRKLIKKYGKKKVFEKGLQVYTTLDVNKQIAAQAELRKSLAKQTNISSRLAFKNDDYIYDNFSDMVNLFSLVFDIAPFKKTGSRQVEKFNNYIQKKIIEEFEGLNYFFGFETIDKFLDSYKRRYLHDKDFQKVEGCLISIDHKTGHIEALVGGSEFSSINQLNRTMQSKRQPGSAIKPLLYAAAMETGKFNPASGVLDSPIIYLDNDGSDWIPENYEGSYFGLVRLRKALALSINVVSIKMAHVIGIETVMKYYSKLLKFNKKERKRRIPRNFSIALGSLEVSPFELTRAYAIIANGGKDVIPYSIRYIKDAEGNIIENKEKDIKQILLKKQKKGLLQIIKPSTAQIMISMLRSVVAMGTAGAARTKLPTAGKTGTTNNYKDAWFIGFTPYLTTGIWIGYDGLGLSLGRHQSGGGIAAPIWGRYMNQAMKFEKPKGFPVYAGLVSKEVCKKTGLLPSSDCKNTIKEVFIPGHLPGKECDLCSKSEDNSKLQQKGPKDNISKKQKRTILNNLNKDNKKVIDDIDNLLD